MANIIKNSQISRGSFYQYFEDKKDVLVYVMKLIGDKKMEYMSDVMQNPDKVPFLVLFKELYISGLSFALENPKFIRIAANIMTENSEVYDEIFKEQLIFARDFYKELIDLDKERGRIKPEIDSLIFATMVRDMTVNISIAELDLETKEFNYNKIIERITQIIKIFEIGVKQGEYDV